MTQGVEITEAATLCTSHICEATAALLQEAALNVTTIDGLTVYEKQNYGFFVYRNDIEVPDEVDIPEDLQNILNYFDRHYPKVTILIFDSDGEECDDLPTCNW